VIGVPDVRDGIIELPIGKQFGTGGEKMCVDEDQGQPARTRYRVVERAGNRACWVELQPFTGRTHQLRVHMEAIGHPIVGDGKYGGQDAYLTGTISRKLHLHARRLRIDHPDGGQVDVVAELPDHMAASFATLGFELAQGDLPLDEIKYSETPEGKQKAATGRRQGPPQGAQGRAPGAGCAVSANKLAIFDCDGTLGR
jgi:23S rRNA pseudouridine955/2504/2580 synthase